MAQELSGEQISRIVARSLKVSPAELEASIRPAGADDLAAVRALRAPLFNTTPRWDEERYLRWRYHFGNPEQGRGDFYLLQIGKTVIGGIGTEIMSFAVGGQIHSACVVLDLVAAPQYRGTGFGPWINMQICMRFPTVMVLGSNENSVGTVERFYFSPRPRHIYVGLIDSRATLSRSVKPPWLQALLAPAANVALRLWQDHALAASGNNLEVRRIERFGAETSELLATIDNLATESCRPHRDIDWLNWRVFDNPRERYDVWGAFDGQKLQGYLVAHAAANRVSKDRLPLVDWRLCPTTLAQTFKVLLRHEVGVARAAGIGSLAIDLIDARVEKVLARSGFVLRPGETRSFAFRTHDPELRERLLKGEWHITNLDADVE